MSKLVIFHKPFGVLSQFTPADGHPGLSEYLQIPKVYPAGRLDHDSEGLLLLTDDGALQAKISDPKHKLEKTYLAQVEGEISDTALQHLRRGVALKDGMTREAKAISVCPPDIWPRVPPIRQRQNKPTSWLELTISEGRNRQVRRMAAHVGFPVLRLIRINIGQWCLDGLSPGEHRLISVQMPAIQTSQDKSITKPMGQIRKKAGAKPQKPKP